MQHSYTIEVDDREKLPLIFPPFLVFLPAGTVPAINPRVITVELRTSKRRLPFGDYGLAEFPEGCLIERKRSFKELAGNICTAKRRANFLSELRDLRHACRRPILFIEGPARLLRSDDNKEVAGIDYTIRVCREYGVEIAVWSGSDSFTGRQSPAEFLARLLINEALSIVPPRSSNANAF